MNINQFCIDYLSRNAGAEDFERLAAAYLSKGYITSEQLDAIEPTGGEFTEEELRALVANVIAQPPVDAQVNAKLDALMEYMGVKGVWNGSVFEVVKDTEFPSGDFLNPIAFTAPMQVELGKWYFADDPQLPAECVQAGLADIYGAPWLDVIA